MWKIIFFNLKQLDLLTGSCIHPTLVMWLKRNAKQWTRWIVKRQRNQSALLPICGMMVNIERRKITDYRNGSKLLGYLFPFSFLATAWLSMQLFFKAIDAKTCPRAISRDTILQHFNPYSSLKNKLLELPLSVAFRF